MQMNVCDLACLSTPTNHPIDMIIDNDPPIERYISVPRDMSQLSCSSFTAGIVEAVLDGLGFVRLSMYPILTHSHTPLACSRHGPQHSQYAIPLSHHYSDKTRKICTRTRGAIETMNYHDSSAKMTSCLGSPTGTKLCGILSYLR